MQWVAADDGSGGQVVENSVNITQSGIMPPEAHKYMKLSNSVLQSNIERVSKFNNIIQQQTSSNDFIEEEIPEELNDDHPVHQVS